MRPAAIWRGAVAAGGAGFWLAFPVAPVLAADFSFRLLTLGTEGDPREWGPVQWWGLAGPLFGFGFLAGATWGVADEPGGRRWLAWSTRRAAWVGLGPWLGLWVAAAAWLAVEAARRAGVEWPARWTPAIGPAASGAAGVAGVAWLGFGWVAVARPALRRARRAGRLGRSWRAGVGLGAAFAGSLFGAYWVITAAWRDYYFDPTIVP